MRLTEYEIESIYKVFKEVFDNGRIYLFGSRVDNTLKGGDIDLYIQTTYNKDLFQKKINFLTKVKECIGEQKIDVVFEGDGSKMIEIEAKEKGVEMNVNKLKLEKYFHECDKHLQRINEAYEELKTFIPITAKEYEELSKEQVQSIDQYLFRFSKLQDTLGDKVFKLLVSLYEESFFQKTFIDILNTLEKIGYLYSAKEWINLRQIRNNISHQYDDEPELMSQAINEIVNNKTVIEKIYTSVKMKYNEVLSV